jgi:hypothetical protein
MDSFASRQRSAALALVVVVVAAAVFACDAKAADYSSVMAIAALQSHGFSGDAVPLEELEAQVARGERITVSCGTVAQLGVRAAERAGLRARLVATRTLDPYTGDDGHMLFEIHTRKGWTLWDLDTNVRAPAGVGIDEVTAAHGEIPWRSIASDPLIAETTWTNPDGTTGYWNPSEADLHVWRHHIFGVPMVYSGPELGLWYFRGPQRAAVEASSSSYVWAGRATWEELTN